MKKTFLYFWPFVFVGSVLLLSLNSWQYDPYALASGAILVGTCFSWAIVQTVTLFVPKIWVWWALALPTLGFTLWLTLFLHHRHTAKTKGFEAEACRILNTAKVQPFLFYHPVQNWMKFAKLRLPVVHVGVLRAEWHKGCRMILHTKGFRTKETLVFARKTVTYLLLGRKHYLAVHIITRTAPKVYFLSIPHQVRIIDLVSSVNPNAKKSYQPKTVRFFTPVLPGRTVRTTLVKTNKVKRNV